MDLSVSANSAPAGVRDRTELGVNFGGEAPFFNHFDG